MIPKSSSPSKKEEQKLLWADELVDRGVSREVADSLITQLHDIIDGAWADLLAPMTGSKLSPERILLQTLWIRYLEAWVDERLLLAAVAQAAAINRLASKNPNRAKTVKDIPNG